MIGSPVWIPIFAVAVYLAAQRGGLYYLLLFDLGASLVFNQDWFVGGMRIDGTDLTMAGVAYLAISGREPAFRQSFWKLPAIRLWLLLGLLISISYFFIPGAAQKMTDPLRMVYQVYRYCWRTIFFFPLAMVVVANHGERATTILKWIAVLGAITASYSIVQAMTIGESLAFYHTKNMLAGSLVIPVTLALGAAIGSADARGRLRSTICLGVIALGLILAGSRGAVVATAAGFASLGLPMTYFAGSRQRLLRLGIVGALAAVIGIAALPTDNSLKGVESLTELSKGTQVDNLTWRMELRWPHFWKKALEHPWVGSGVARDLTLGEDANTPHNGYLSLLMLRGFPATIAMVLMVVLCGIRGLRTFYRDRLPASARYTGLSAAAALFALFIHNLAETTFVTGWPAQVMYVVTAIAAVSATLGSSPVKRPELPKFRNRRQAPNLRRNSAKMAAKRLK